MISGPLPVRHIMLQIAVIQEWAAPGAGNRAGTVITLTGALCPRKTKVLSPPGVQVELKWSSGTMGKWCPCGSPGKMDQAGPLTPINKF